MSFYSELGQSGQRLRARHRRAAQPLHRLMVDESQADAMAAPSINPFTSSNSCRLPNRRLTCLTAWLFLKDGEECLPWWKNSPASIRKEGSTTILWCSIPGESTKGSGPKWLEVSAPKLAQADGVKAEGGQRTRIKLNKNTYVRESEEMVGH